MEVKIKKLNPKACVPSYAKSGDAGLDLTAVAVDRPQLDRNGVLLTYRTGLAVEIPKGYVGLLFPRSSLSKKAMLLTNSVGVIDSGYRGEIILKFRDTSNGIGRVYDPGDKVGQLVIMPYPKINFIEVDELTETDRGDGGFGSTDT